MVGLQGAHTMLQKTRKNDHDHPEARQHAGQPCALHAEAMAVSALMVF